MAPHGCSVRAESSLGQRLKRTVGMEGTVSLWHDPATGRRDLILEPHVVTGREPRSTLDRVITK